MNYDVHIRVVRDSWDLLKAYLEPGLIDERPLLDADVEASLRFLYDLPVEAWSLHDPNELADPTGSARLKAKTHYANRDRTKCEQYGGPPTTLGVPAEVPTKFRPTGTHPDQVGMLLAYQAGHIDDLEDTWAIHALLEALDALADAGVEVINEFTDAVDVGVEAILAPFYAIGYALCRLFGGCEDAPLPGDVIPDIPDIPEPDFPYGEGPYHEGFGKNFTSFWHFINMMPGGQVGPLVYGNQAIFDDHDGYYYAHGPGSWGEMAIDAATTITQSHLVPEYRNDPCSHDAHGPMVNYQIPVADDGHPATIIRPVELYADPTLFSVMFNPVDNLAKYGWDRWRESRELLFLGYPLHAITDCATAQHTAPTIFHDHPDYEDYVAHHYDRPAADGQPLVRHDHQGVWGDVGRFMGIVHQTWAADQQMAADKQLPLRNLLTELAADTYADAVYHGMFDSDATETDWTNHARTSLRKAMALTIVLLAHAGLGPN